MWTSCTIGMLGHETFIYLSGFGAARVFAFCFSLLCKKRDTPTVQSVSRVVFGTAHERRGEPRSGCRYHLRPRVPVAEAPRAGHTHLHSPHSLNTIARLSDRTPAGGVSDAAPRITLHSHAVRLACTMAHKPHSLKSTLDRPSLTHRRLPRATRADSASSPLSP